MAAAYGLTFVIAGIFEPAGFSKDLMFVCANMWFCIYYLKARQ